MSINTKAAGKHHIWTTPEAEVDEQTFTNYSWWETEKEKETKKERGGASVGTQEQKVSQSKTGLMSDVYYNLPSAFKTST